MSGTGDKDKAKVPLKFQHIRPLAAHVQEYQADREEHVSKY
jgi:hypothetical protein